MAQLSLAFNETTPVANIDKYIANCRGELKVKRFNHTALLSRENKSKSRSETAEINSDFVKHQMELQKRFNLSDDEIMTATIEEKLQFKQKLNFDEVKFANENFWKPVGFYFNYFGLVVDTNYFRYFET